MPGFRHEFPLLLLEECPELVRSLSAACAPQIRLSASDPVRFSDTALNEIVPTEYRADAVILIGEPTRHAVAIEVQRTIDRLKPYIWTLYLASIFAREKVPTTLMVFTPSIRVERWARAQIQINPAHSWTPRVLGPRWCANILTSQVLPNPPQLGVLALHLAERKVECSHAFIEQTATWLARPQQLADDTARLYRDVVRQAVDSPTRAIIEAIMGIEKYGYESATFQRVFGEGREEGREQGEIFGLRRALRRTVIARFGRIPDELNEKVERCASADQLDAWLELVLRAQSIDQLNAREG